MSAFSGDAPDTDKFDDVDEPIWDVHTILNKSDVKDVDKEKLCVLCDHKRKMKQIEAFKKIMLALIAAIPTILVLLSSLLDKFI